MYEYQLHYKRFRDKPKDPWRTKSFFFLGQMINYAKRTPRVLGYKYRIGMGFSKLYPITINKTGFHIIIQ